MSDGEIWQRGGAVSEKCDASEKERNIAFRKGRQGRSREKQKASYRNWAFRSTQKRSESAAEEVQLRKAAQKIPTVTNAHTLSTAASGQAVYSLVDSTNGILLLFGSHRSQKPAAHDPATRSHAPANRTGGRLPFAR